MEQTPEERIAAIRAAAKCLKENAKVKIHNVDHFDRAVEFGVKLETEGFDTGLGGCLNAVGRWVDGDATGKVFMFPDWVKHSWEFTQYHDGQFTMNGGIILHGYGETFSVELNPKSGPHWSVHT